MSRSERIYRRLLGLYPRAFRERYRDALVEAFRADRTERTGTHRRPGPDVVFWVRIVADLLVSAARIRLTGARRIEPGLLRTEARAAARRLARRPGFTAAAVLTIALGVGTTTAAYSVIDTVLLRPLPWHDPDGLVTIWQVRPEWRDDPLLAAFAESGTFSWSAFLELGIDGGPFSELAAWTAPGVVLAGDPNQLVPALQVSAGLLPMLGAEPALGRSFVPAEDGIDTGAALLSHESWLRRFGGSPDVLGRAVVLDGAPAEIVGVLAPGFRFGGERPELLLPLGRLSADARENGGNFLGVVGRLRDGATPADAEAFAAAVARRGGDPSREARATLLTEEERGAFARPLWLILSAAGGLLLIGLANVGGLVVAEAQRRRSEIEVRTALGAGTSRLIGHSTMEAAWLGCGGGGAGLLLAVWLAPLLTALSPEPLPGLDDVGVNVGALAVSAVAAVAASVAFGLGAAAASLRAQRTRQGGLARAPSRRPLSAWIVAGQVALAFSILVGAGLLTETLVRLDRRPLGFDERGLVLVSVRPPPEVSGSAEARADLTRALTERLGAVAGIGSAAGTAAAPFGGGFATTRVAPEPGAERTIAAQQVAVTPGYFDVLRAPLVAGRSLRADDVDGPAVAVVSRSFEQIVLGGSGVGRRFVARDTFEVVGVVSDLRQQRIGDDPPIAFYALERDLPVLRVEHFVLRADRAERIGMAELRGAVHEVDPGATVTRVETLEALIAGDTAAERFRAALATAFGALALIIAATGLYGTVARSVASRRHEVGVRLALGAERTRIFAMIARQGGRIASLGLLLGAPLAALGVHGLRLLLADLAQPGLHHFAVPAALLALVTLVASAAPALAASRTPPSEALLSE